ncbi:unnamed protein product [Ambrosiozyma monospora]|uniref:Unnamed protein product n=1 Tax=Ambrosiozyma monospora TaxID=43982 RepID=A0ACB5STR3_AMBMO|nr:unnamed protein product [Ambrosiozyma monospora]
MSILGIVTPYLPQAQGYLPKWLFFIAVVSGFNTAQTYVDLNLTKKVYGGQPEQVTPLSARTFGTWTLISALIRLYTSYCINERNVYNICILSYCIALWHFGSEWLYYKTVKFDKGLAGPLIVSTLSITWMLTQRDFYTAGAADVASSVAAGVTSAL